jgi:hypothetical protein
MGPSTGEGDGVRVAVVEIVGVAVMEIVDEADGVKFQQ